MRRLDRILDGARSRSAPMPSPRRRRSLRRQAGLTQAELGSVLGVSGTTVARWESGLRSPNGSNKSRYLALLDELAKRSAT